MGQKFKVKGSLDNQVVKSLEFNRPATQLTLEQLKQGFERAFNVGTLGLRYKFADGRVQPIYQDFHIQDAIKDCEKTGQKFMNLYLIRESGSGSYTPSTTAPRQTTPTVSNTPPKPQPTSTPSSSTSSSSSTPRKFCEECGATLVSNVKFCPECGHSIGTSAPTPTPSSYSSSTQSAPKSSSSDQMCAGCGNALGGSAVKALDKTFHRECFVCVSCHKSLATGGFLDDSHGNPICSECFDNRYVKKCSHCGRAIDGPYVSAEGKEFHKTCFVCSNCGSSFDGGYFMSDGKPKCKNCV